MIITQTRRGNMLAIASEDSRLHAGDLGVPDEGNDLTLQKILIENATCKAQSSHND